MTNEEASAFLRMLSHYRIVARKGNDRVPSLQVQAMASIAEDELRGVADGTIKLKVESTRKAG